MGCDGKDVVGRHHGGDATDEKISDDMEISSQARR